MTPGTAKVWVLAVQQKKPETAVDRLTMIAEKQATTVVDLGEEERAVADELRKGARLEMTLFAFCRLSGPEVYESAQKAEAAVYPDPRTACFYARRTLELAGGMDVQARLGLRLPYQDNLSALIHEPTFKATAGERCSAKVRLINTLGISAVHSHGRSSRRTR